MYNRRRRRLVIFRKKYESNKKLKVETLLYGNDIKIVDASGTY